jgi:hypothetical protein
MEQTECSETSAYKIQMPVNYPEESTQQEYVKIIKECKAIPLQAWTGPEDSRTLRLPDFKTIGT